MFRPGGNKLRVKSIVQSDIRSFVRPTESVNSIVQSESEESESDDDSEDEYLPMEDDILQMRYEKMMNCASKSLSLSKCMYN